MSKKVKREITWRTNAQDSKANGFEGTNNKLDVIIDNNGIAKNNGYRINGNGKDSIFLLLNGSIKIGANIAENATKDLKDAMTKCSTKNNMMPFIISKANVTKTVWSDLAKAAGKKTKTRKASPKAKAVKMPEETPAEKITRLDKVGTTQETPKV